MSSLSSRLVCAGCGAERDADDPLPFRCPNTAAADDVEHVLERRIDLTDYDFPRDGDPHPFVRFRQLLHVYRAARRAGVEDHAWCENVRARFGGRTFTPFRAVPGLAAELGGANLWIKDETGGLAGSHKARHLIGIALDRTLAATRDPRLAIASCGNAALAACAVAEASGWQVETFVPDDADPAVLAQLEELGAQLVTCTRRSGDPPGDPCWHALERALGEGALPFTVAGPANGLAIEGAATLAWEVVAQDEPGTPPIDDWFVQVGGGALMSACWLGLRDAHALGAITRLPRLHAVQTAGGHPLERAWRRLATELATAADVAFEDDAELAACLFERREDALVQDGLARAARQRSRYMWPWESPPVSIATGILDDETYDWLACVRAMIETGGRPLVVTDDEIARAQAAAIAVAGVHVCATGAAGLAGWMAAQRGSNDVGRAVVLLTGIQR